MFIPDLYYKTSATAKHWVKWIAQTLLLVFGSKRIKLVTKWVLNGNLKLLISKTLKAYNFIGIFNHKKKFKMFVNVL